MNMEKIKEVFADEAFVKGLFELESAAEVQAALQEKGVEMSEEEILGIRELLVKVDSGEITVEQLEQWVAQVESGELSEELLEQVSGGVVTIGIGTIVGIVAVGTIIVGAAATATAMLISTLCRERW